MRFLEGRKRMAHSHTEGALKEHQPPRKWIRRRARRKKRRAETVKDKTQRHGK